MEINHKGWDWTSVESESWNKISEEFLPVAMQWREKYNSLLDIGAGKGRHAFYFAHNGFDVGAVDLSQSSIEYIKSTSDKMGLKVNAMVSDMTKLPFMENQFDCVICFHTIYHTNYEGMKKTIGEIKRVLKTGGEAFISFNSKENPYYILEESEDGYTMKKKDGLEDGIPHCYVDEADITELLKDLKIIYLSKIQNYVRKEKEAHGIHYYAHIRVEN